MLRTISAIDSLVVSPQCTPQAPAEPSEAGALLQPLSPWLAASAVDVRGSLDESVLAVACSSARGSRLRKLTLRNNHVCAGLEACGELSAVRELVLNNAPLISSLEAVASRLVMMTEGATGRRRRGIEESSLQTLFVRCNRAMGELPLLMPLSLLHVTLRDTALSSLDGLVRCRMLLELDISQNKHIVEIPASLALGEHMPYLRRVNASQTRITGIAGLAECPSLETLVLDSTPMLRSLPAVPALRELYVNYSGLADFGSIENHPRLEVLEAAWSRELSAVPCLPSVRVLRLEGCSLLMELGMLHGNASLERLHIEHCRLVTSLPSLPSLRVLSATCTGLTSDAVEDCLSGHQHIEEVNLRGCPGIKRELPNIYTLKKIVVDDDNCV